MTAHEQLRRAFDTDGYVIVEDVLPPDFIARARRELERAIESEVDYHGTRDYKDFGMVLLCSLYGGSFLQLFDHERFLEPFHAVLGEGCTVYAYTSSSMPPGRANYSSRIHVDSPRIIPGYVTNVGATIPLDDFTEANGATWFLPGSHRRAEPPGEEEFYGSARRFVAKAGSVWFFNARIWHAGAPNTTASWRHALTVNMCRPWMKQRLDIPRAMAHMDLSGVSERSLQKLGFLAQVPASYDEYYAPPERRKYRQKAE
jgi:ectoine hydroxylase-related dioxygenase (phytanoyl-CoA dioxygenase family)